MSESSAQESPSKKKSKTPKIRKNKQKNESIPNSENQELSSDNITFQKENQNLGIYSFFKALCEKNFKFIILQFTQSLEKKFKNSQAKTLEIWNEISAGSGLEIEINSSIPDNESQSSESRICQHYMPRANRNCSSSVSSKSKTGKYCGQHLKYEDGKSEEKKEEKKQCEHESKNGNRCKKKIYEEDDEGKYCSKHIQGQNSEEKPKSKKNKKSEGEVLSKNSEVVLRPRKHSSLDVYFDAATNFVIDNETKKVYGKLESEQILPLRKEDEEWLQKNHYEYSNSIMEKK